MRLVSLFYIIIILGDIYFPRTNKDWRISFEQLILNEVDKDLDSDDDDDDVSISLNETECILDKSMSALSRNLDTFEKGCSDCITDSSDNNEMACTSLLSAKAAEFHIGSASKEFEHVRAEELLFGKFLNIGEDSDWYTK